MEKEKQILRTFSGGMSQPRLREAVEGEQATGRTIEGYAIVFERESVLLADYWENYHEIIHAGAITQEELDRMDIKMDMYHNREKLLARCNKGEGTLRLTVDEVGVKYEFEAPETADGNTALELVKRGDISGSSFVFWCDERSGVTYTKDENDLLVRHVNKIGMIYSMTLAIDPAYGETTASAREVEEHGISLQKKDAVAKAEKEKAEREAASKKDAAWARNIANSRLV